MKRFLKRGFRILLAAYLVLLAASHLKRWWAPLEADPSGGQKLFLAEGFGKDRGEKIAIAYRDVGAFPGGHAASAGETSADRPPLLLVHGSPVGSAVFDPLIEELRADFRILAPDLPGHGNSTPDVSDGSFAADADYLDQLLGATGGDPVHVLAYSRGGGPALLLAERHPERVKSLVLLSSIGVQEQELLGNHALNNALHTVQLGFFHLLEELTPHFVYLDDAILNSDYARSFSDSDQRPLRGILSRLDVPLLLLHGTADALVPAAAALEHHRIAPRSELRLLPGGHLLVVREPVVLAAAVEDFARRVDAGQPVDGSVASPDSGTGAPPPAAGFHLLVAILFFATFVSEDLTCVVAGLLAAAGTLSFPIAAGACFAGILAGDFLIFLVGRIFGARAVRRAPFRWVLTPDRLRFAREWFRRRGAMTIVTSRFVPGSRLPVYFTAGMARASVGKFLLYFGIASAIWTPAVVGLAMLLGEPLLRFFEEFEIYALPALAGLVVLFLVLTKGVVPCFTRRGRRIFRGRWKRLTRWEFWPRQILYPPVVLWILWLGLRHRRPSLFTAVNPAMPAGGIAFESKGEIYRRLETGGGTLAATRILPPEAGPEEKRRLAREFQDGLAKPFPVVCKPDQGERGDGVRIVGSEPELAEALERTTAPILQEFVPGLEYGLFYERRPSESTGRITSITRKIHTAVRGDGERTLEELILDDDRAVCAYPYFRRLHRERLFEVPSVGEEIELAPLGTHCRGSLFLDGVDLGSPALRRAIDRVFEGTEGLQFGRIDVKCPSDADFREGREIVVLEFNGLSSEPTHIYDPKHSLLYAYRTLFAQWRRAFALGAENARRGVEPWPPGKTLGLLCRALRGHRPDPRTAPSPDRDDAGDPAASARPGTPSSDRP